MKIAEYASMAWNTASESTVLGLIVEVLGGRAKFLEIWLLCRDQLLLHLSYNKCFWLLLRRSGPVWTRKSLSSRLDYVTRSSKQLSNQTRNEKTHQLPRYYQPQQIPTTAWNASVMQYTSHKLTHIANCLNSTS